MTNQNKYYFFLFFTGFSVFLFINKIFENPVKKIYIIYYMRGFYFGFSLCLLQTLYYDHKRNLKQKEFDKKMIEYLKKIEKNI